MEFSIGQVVMGIILVLAALITRVWPPYTMEKKEMTSVSPQQQPQMHVAVCILSARENHKQRDAIRESWMSGYDKTESISQPDSLVLSRFVIGQEACLIPPEDRVSPYGCQEWTADLTEDLTQDFAMFAASEEGIKNQQASLDEMHGWQTPGFVVKAIHINVLHSVTIKRLGVLASLDLTDHPMTVSVFDAVTDDLLVEAPFSVQDPGIIKGGYRYQPVQPIVLSQGREVEITIGENERGTALEPMTIDGLSSISLGASLQYRVRQEKGPGVMNVEGLLDDETTAETDEFGKPPYLPLLSAMYSVDNAEALFVHALSRSKRREQWVKEKEAEDAALRREMDRHGDVLNVSGVDTYRSLPGKLLQCHQWLAQHFQVDNVVKTDDDTYLNLAGISAALRQRPLQDLEWWGNFRTGWDVNRGGKWRERHYPAPSYPSFPCGSGYVVSGHLHRWLAQNSKQLHHYQGEDVSLGIWLAALLPSRRHDSRFQCTATPLGMCQPGLLAMPDLTYQDLITMWGQSIHCGDPCNRCGL